MEFSILIPVYNYNIEKLVQALLEQAIEVQTPFEILCIDDCSDLSSSYLNRKITQLDPRISYEILAENIGRAAIRNLLFSQAKYENCIVLDCDVSLIDKKFIQKYLDQIKEQEILMGGHLYATNPPKEAQKYLHWLYGTMVESKSVQDSNKSHFLSSNFACKKSCFQQIQFNESFKEYGHEDTLLGFEAKQKGIHLKKIYNPVQHDGLENASVFLAKQKQAIIQLNKLYKHAQYGLALVQNFRLIAWGNKKWLVKFLHFFEKEIAKNLLSEKPTILALQIQKMLWWQEIQSQKNKTK